VVNTSRPSLVSTGRLPVVNMRAAFDRQKLHGNKADNLSGCLKIR